MATDYNSASGRAQLQLAVREIIASIKEIGLDEVGDDVPLFPDGQSEPSPIEMDSLDGLDLALGLKERFDPEGDRFEALLNGETDFQALGTVNKIVDFIIVAAHAADSGGSALTRPGAAMSQRRPG